MKLVRNCRLSKSEKNKEIITSKAHVLMYQLILKTLRKKRQNKCMKTLREIDIGSTVSLFVGELFAVNVFITNL